MGLKLKCGLILSPSIRKIKCVFDPLGYKRSSEETRCSSAMLFKIATNKSSILSLINQERIVCSSAYTDGKVPRSIIRSHLPNWLQLLNRLKPLLQAKSVGSVSTKYFLSKHPVSVRHLVLNHSLLMRNAYYVFTFISCKINLIWRKKKALISPCADIALAGTVVMSQMCVERPAEIAKETEAAH